MLPLLALAVALHAASAQTPCTSFTPYGVSSSCGSFADVRADAPLNSSRLFHTTFEGTGFYFAFLGLPTFVTANSSELPQFTLLASYNISDPDTLTPLAAIQQQTWISYGPRSIMIEIPTGSIYVLINLTCGDTFGTFEATAVADTLYRFQLSTCLMCASCPTVPPEVFTCEVQESALWQGPYGAGNQYSQSAGALLQVPYQRTYLVDLSAGVISPPVIDSQGNIYALTQGNIVVVGPGGLPIQQYVVAPYSSTPLVLIDDMFFFFGVTAASQGIALIYGNASYLGYIPTPCNCFFLLADNVHNTLFLGGSCLARYSLTWNELMWVTPNVGVGDIVYDAASESVFTLGDTLRAYDATTGAPRWGTQLQFMQATGEGRNYADRMHTLVVASHVVVVSSAQINLPGSWPPDSMVFFYGVDANTGVLRWNSSSSGMQCTTILAVDKACQAMCGGAIPPTEIRTYLKSPILSIMDMPNALNVNAGPAIPGGMPLTKFTQGIIGSDGNVMAVAYYYEASDDDPTPTSTTVFQVTRQQGQIQFVGTLFSNNSTVPSAMIAAATAGGNLLFVYTDSLPGAPTAEMFIFQTPL